MRLTEKIDLHMHTRVSDGTDDPSEMLSRAKEAGLGLFAVSDHDEVKGCGIIRALRGADDPRFLCGVEFSCKDEEGQYHILGYGHDPEAPALLAATEKGHGYRMSKMKARVAGLREMFGFTFPEEEIDRLLALDNPGKPHLGNLMAALGYAPDRPTAIREYINKVHAGGTEYLRPEEAIAAILEGGWIPVLAHPSYGRGDDLILGEDMDRRLRKLIGFGLQGVEAFYSGFTDKLRGEVLGFAERYGLYVTAGSDYHGTNKLVKIGDTGLEIGMEMPDGLARFLKAVE